MSCSKNTLELLSGLYAAVLVSEFEYLFEESDLLKETYSNDLILFEPSTVLKCAAGNSYRDLK